MSRSVLNSAISTLARNVVTKCHCVAISSSVSPIPAARAASNPVPTPYQPGMIWRDCVHPNTHGIARRSASAAADSVARRAGREPMFRPAISSTGVEAVK